MFDDLVECSPTRTKTNKPWTVILSTVVQCGVLGFLVLIPLIYTEALPRTMLTTLLVAPRRLRRLRPRRLLRRSRSLSRWPG